MRNYDVESVLFSTFYFTPKWFSMSAKATERGWGVVGTRKIAGVLYSP